MVRLRCCQTLALVSGLLIGIPGGAEAAPKPAPARVSVRAKPESGAKPSRRTSAGRVVKASKARKRPRFAPVELFHVNRKEELDLRIADSRGRALNGNQKRLDRFLRCHHTNKQHRMDSRLIRLIYEVGRHYDGRRIEVVSGYRDPGVAKNPKSPHKQGLACDFRVHGIPNQELRDYLRKTYNHVGVGYYPNSSFVHLDVRKGSSAFWIDYSSPGANALYSESPAEDLRSGRADIFKPTAIDPAWAKDSADKGLGDEGCCQEAATTPPPDELSAPSPTEPPARATP